MKTSQIVYQVLRELRYYAVSKRCSLVRRALEDAFNGVGEKDEIAELFLHHLSLIHDIDDNELANRFDIVEDAIYSIFGESAAVIIELVTEYLLANDPAFKNNYSSTISLSQNLYKLADKDVLEFVRSLPPHEHVLFLYRQQKSKAPIFLYYFDKLATADMQKGAVCSQNLDIPEHFQVDQISYFSVVDDSNTSIDAKKWMDWVSRLSNKRPNTSLRILGEEDTWFFDNGLASQILALERQIGRRVGDSISYLCTYNITKLDDKETLAELIQAHNYIILDRPYSLYRSPQ